MTKKPSENTAPCAAPGCELLANYDMSKWLPKLGGKETPIHYLCPAGHGTVPLVQLK